LPKPGKRSILKAVKDIKVFKGIGQLVTLASAAARKGRRAEAGDLAAIRDAAIVSVGGVIKWVGPEKEMPKAYKSARATSLRGAVVVPGLVECHTHLIYAGTRSAEFERRNQGESYQSIAKSGGGILSTVKATREASETELTESGQKRIDRFLSQGVTTVEVKSGYGLTLKDEMKMLRAARALKGARIVPTFLGAHAIPKEFANADAYVDELITYLPKIKKLARRVDAFVENGYFSAQTTRRYLEAATKLGFSASIHADQLTLSGGSMLAIEQKATSADHLVQLGAKEIKALAASPVTCVLLPSADLYMDCAYPNARALIDSGACVALSTDFNPGTSPSQDVALVGLLARVRMKMSLAETLVAYTVGSAHALGLEKQIGSIEIGKSCDFAVLTGELDELFLDAGHMPVARTFCQAQDC
jgi:imidazolonepropionase